VERLRELPNLGTLIQWGSQYQRIRLRRDYEIAGFAKTVFGTTKYLGTIYVNDRNY
jgi:hypothetical protein